MSPLEATHKNTAYWRIQIGNHKTAAWLVQLAKRRNAVPEVEGSSPRPDQHSGS